MSRAAALFLLLLGSAPAPAAQTSPRPSLLLADLPGLTPADAASLARDLPGAASFAQAVSPGGEAAPAAASLLTAQFVQTHGLVAPGDRISTAAATLAEVLGQAGWETGAFAADPALDAGAGFSRGFQAAEFAADASSAALNRVLGDAATWLSGRRGPVFLYFHASRPAAESLAAFRTLKRACPAPCAAALTAGRGPADGPELGERAVHVPLLVWHPDLAPRRIDAVVRLVDLGPALLEWAGVAVPESFQGASLAPLAAGENEPSPRYGFSAAGRQPGQTALYSIRSADWQLLFDRPRDESRLYDLKADPGMTKDVQELRPDVALDLTQRLIRHLRETRASSRKHGEMSPELLRELRRKGYW